MIKARRLFLIPALSAIILAPLFPFGLIIWAIILAGWYANNSEEIEAFIKGHVYKKNEYANEDELK